MGKSIDEMLLSASGVLIIGMGGGGDIIQGIPVANWVRLLGPKRAYLAGVACQWWPFDVPSPYTMMLAPTVYPVGELVPAQEVVPGVVRVGPESAYRGRRPAEAAVAEALGEPTLVFDLLGGGRGLRRSLEAAVEHLGVDLVVGVDAGSDSLYSGEEEVRPPRTPLTDFLVLSALAELRMPVAYGLAGYGCDGELALPDLHRNVARVMRAGGYLGAHGLGPGDVEAMERACRAFPDPVEGWPARAARGELGLRVMKLMDPWGTIVELTPFMAVTMFFDPRVVVSAVTRVAAEVADTASLAEAEEVLLRRGLIPETRLPRAVDFVPPVGERGV